MADIPQAATPIENRSQPPAAVARWKLFWVAAYILPFILIWFIGYRLVHAAEVPPPELGDVIARLLPLTVVIYVSLVFVQIYTGPITNSGGEAEAPRSWFVFAYAFMVSALIIAIAPFVAKVQTPREVLALRPISILLGCAEDPEKKLPNELRCHPVEPKPNAGSAAPNDQWILNVGGSIQASANCAGACNVVRGGLTVPLYVVILALVGGAISLTRRVPEHQKQADPNYKQIEANQPKLELPLLREYLVFQIVQYVSAPFIAVTAYYAIKPSDTPSTVALAFLSGFASEPILMMIRGIIDKISPTPDKATGRGSVSVRVERAGEPVKDAAVTIVGQPTLKAKIDGEKRYVFDSVPAGEHAVEVKSGTDTKTVKVTVNEGKVGTCEVKL